MNRTLLLLVTLVVGLGAGLGVARYTNMFRTTAGQSGPGADTVAREILYWTAPMDPSYRGNAPGKSPMGMDLIPVYADAAGGGSEERGAVVTIDPDVVQNLGVRSVEINRRALSQDIESVGYLDYDETLMSHIHTRTDGWIERLLVKAEGERVKRGQLLFELYSPTLVNAQEEYLEALAGKRDGLITASRERLHALGISDAQVKRLTDSRRVSQRVQLYASQDGVISKLNVREGMYVKPATEVMTLADLRQVWFLAEVFERQAFWVAAGQAAEARLDSLPGRKWEGRVDHIYPALDPVTRTLRVRLRFENPDELLKPNMFAHVSIFGEETTALAVPREALIRGREGARVILDLGNGHFAPRDVVTGIESGEYVEIVSGLQEGQRVVASGQFLIDSEASLKASMHRLQPADVDGEQHHD